MNKTYVLSAGASALTDAGSQSNNSPATIKLGVDVHAACYVVVAQYDHALPRSARRFGPADFVPWVKTLLAAGHAVHVVYEACGFGFGLQRQLAALGAHCVVIAPQKLDERCTRVKTDARDALTLCQRLSRYVDGNTRELAVVRIPTEEEERTRHLHRQREQLVRHRCKLEAAGRRLLINHGRAAPSHWHRPQTWGRLKALLPAWLAPLLETYRPILLALEAQIALLTEQLTAAAPAQIPRGIGELSTVILSREACDWHRFKNRRQVSSYTGLTPGEHSSGQTRVQGSVTKRGNPRMRACLVEMAWRLVRFQPDYPPVKKRLGILAKGSRATGPQRKKAIVAVARRVAVDLWRLHTGQCTAQKLGFIV